MSDSVSLDEQRIESLDSLRGLAVLMVLFFHYTCRFQPAYYGYPSRPAIALPFGNLGVQLFFVISGFVITMTLVRCESQFEFLWKRFARLYPAYWFAVTLTFSAVALL